MRTFDFDSHPNCWTMSYLISPYFLEKVIDNLLQEAFESQPLYRMAIEDELIQKDKDNGIKTMAD